MTGTYPDLIPLETGPIPLKNYVNMKKKKKKKKKKKMKRYQALARGDQPLPICNQKYVCIFFHPPIPEKFLPIPSTPKNNLSRGSPEALARYVNPLQYLNKYVSIFFPPPPHPPAHKKNPATPPPPPPPTKKNPN